MPEENITQLVAHLVLQLAIILVAAKLAGELTQRVLKQPPVLGELAAGIVIGPYALGSLPLPGLGPLFALHPGRLVPVSNELFALAQIAAVVLLFVVGLETDLGQFLRYGPAAAAVALGGVILPFALGDGATVLLGFAPSFMHPTALFMGAILTATSVGITARVLSDIGKLDSAEGVTILGGAVVDDVLGILVLAIAVGIGATGTVSPAEVGLVGAKALGFWLGLTALTLLLASRISRTLLSFRIDGTAVALALAVALVGAFLAESVGLALIIGAYSVGLALSQTPLARSVEHQLRAVYHVLVPVFFVVMGMFVDVPAMGTVLVFGAIITVLAIAGKLVGAALPALAVGFTPQGALRIGIGMLPRGEVALIVAGVGLTSGIIGADIFGVAVMMTVATTLLAPVLLQPAFSRGGPGRRDLPAPPPPPQPPLPEPRWVIELAEGAAELFTVHLERVLAREGFELLQEIRDPEGPTVVQYRKDREYLSFKLESPQDGQRRLVLEFETPRWSAILSRVVQEATRGMVMGVLEPLIGERDGTLLATMRESIAELVAEMDDRAVEAAALQAGRSTGSR